MSGWWGGIVTDCLAIFGEKMLVTRMQDHMFTTSDGTTHLIVNLGIGKGLVIMTSTDGGITYTQSQTLEGSDFQSTSDVILLADGLTAITAYVGEEGNLILSVQQFDPVSQIWTTAGQTIVPTPDLHSLNVNPTLAAVPGGGILVSYTEPKLRGTEVTLCLSDDMGETWTQTSVLLQGESSGSACLVATGDLLGTIVATNSFVLWAQVDAQGQTDLEMISLEGVAGNFASHFSAASQDGAVYLGVATSDHALAFFTYDPQSQDWTRSAPPAGSGTDVRWVQTSVAEDGSVYLVYDDEKNGRIIVMETTDDGQTWTRKAALELPYCAKDDYFRFEVSEQTVGDMEVIVQIDVGDVGNALYTFVVDVDDNGFDNSAASEPIAPTVDYFTF